MVDNINKLELKIKNSKNMKKNSITLGIDDAEKLLKEVQEIKEQVKELSHTVDETIYIELDGGTF